MAKDEKSRQKKLARKTAKRKEKQRQIRSAGSLSKTDQAARQSRKPVLGCVVPTQLFDTGIGTVVFARGEANGEIAMATFLVDVWCLGIKNAMYRVGDAKDYAMCLRMASVAGPTEDWEPACVKKLLQEVTAWAGDLGFSPHPDARMGMALLGEGVDADECTREFSFGKEGKPFFTMGPHDSPRRTRQILETLECHCGAGNFHYLLPLEGGASLSALEDLDEDDVIEGELDESSDGGSD